MDFPKISKEDVKKILDHKPNVQPERTTLLFANVKENADFFAVKEVHEFLLQLDMSGFNLIFDYLKWVEETGNHQSNEFLTDPDFVQTADLETLRKLMTTHIRTERFVEGHLKELFDNGYIANLMNRLEVLYGKM